ncbi:hypothetical protein A2U01_0049758, partial [Trifolium medium]|nr:hypothetical protein [Trifolium medium]
EHLGVEEEFSTSVEFVEESVIRFSSSGRRMSPIHRYFLRGLRAFFCPTFRKDLNALTVFVIHHWRKDGVVLARRRKRNGVMIAVTVVVLCTGHG